MSVKRLGEGLELIPESLSSMFGGRFRDVNAVKLYPFSTRG